MPSAFLWNLVISLSCKISGLLRAYVNEGPKPAGGHLSPDASFYVGKGWALIASRWLLSFRYYPAICLPDIVWGYCLGKGWGFSSPLSVFYIARNGSPQSSELRQICSSAIPVKQCNCVRLLPRVGAAGGRTATPPTITEAQGADRISAIKSRFLSLLSNELWSDGAWPKLAT